MTASNSGRAGELARAGRRARGASASTVERPAGLGQGRLEGPDPIPAADVIGCIDQRECLHPVLPDGRLGRPESPWETARGRNPNRGSRRAFQERIARGQRTERATRRRSPALPRIRVARGTSSPEPRPRPAAARAGDGMEALGSTRLRRSPTMKNFARLVRFAWPYRVRFGLSLGLRRDGRPALGRQHQRGLSAAEDPLLQRELPEVGRREDRRRPRPRSERSTPGSRSSTSSERVGDPTGARAQGPLRARSTADREATSRRRPRAEAQARRAGPDRAKATGAPDRTPSSTRALRHELPRRRGPARRAEAVPRRSSTATATGRASPTAGAALRRRAAADATRWLGRYRWLQPWVNRYLPARRLPDPAAADRPGHGRASPSRGSSCSSRKCWSPTSCS